MSRRSLFRVARVFPLLLAASMLTTVSTGGETPRRDRTEARLKSVRTEIARISERVSRDEVERDRLTRDLRAAELSVGAARGELERVREERARQAARRAALAKEKDEREADVARERSALGDQLRAAHIIGHEEPLKLLLNQRDPARVSRILTYYGYFGRARAQQVARIQDDISRLNELDEQLQAEDARLAELEREHGEELARVEEARSTRAEVLTKLKAESRTRRETLAKLRKQQASLERLLRELERAAKKLPSVNPRDAFAKLRGKLAWPVTGRLVARFGETRAGGVKWDGVLVATDRGAPVRAVHSGRVIYADWLPGLGLLTIIDHGEGYLSLYGYNERLYRSVGERVNPGDTIAAAGDSGGRTRPELYFEIRKGGRPVDPRPWFNKREPGR